MRHMRQPFRRFRPDRGPLFGVAVAAAIVASPAQLPVLAQPPVPVTSTDQGLVALRSGTIPRGLYGPIAQGGESPEASARLALGRAAGFLGCDPTDLVLDREFGPAGPAMPLMRAAGAQGPKFWFLSYRQTVRNLPVLDARAGVLVRNLPGFPVMAVKANLRPLDGADIPAIPGDLDAAPALAAALDAVPGLTGLTEPTLAIWAGTDEAFESPQIVFEFYGDSADGSDRYRFVAAATTGRLVRHESVRCDADIQVSCRAMATQGTAADPCGSEVQSGLARLGVVLDGTTYFADDGGELTIPWSGSVPVELGASVAGERFATHRAAGGADESITLSVTPPGPALLVFNATNTTIDFRSAANAYIHAGIAYDLVASLAPWLSQQECTVPFDLYVHKGSGQSSSYTPSKGDRCSDGNRGYISFGPGSVSLPSPAFGTVVYHEYGHHLARRLGYSGASSYNEGVADTVAMLVSDQPDVGRGLSGDCAKSVRSAQNTMQWPCYDPIDVHTCAPILAGCFWELRNRLLVTEPASYRAIVTDLALASVPMHVGLSSVSPSVFLDVLTLDNDGAVPLASAGTPHWREIQGAFEAHRMTLADFAGAGSDLQPGPLAFAFPSPPPERGVPGRTVSFEFTVLPMYGTAPVDGDASLSVDTEGRGTFVQVPVERLGPDHYRATISVPDCGARARYYLSVGCDDGRTARYPPAAPDQCVTLTPGAVADQAAIFKFGSGLAEWERVPVNSFATQYPLTGLLNSAGRYPTAGPDVTLTPALSVNQVPVSIDATNATCSVTSPAVDTRGHGKVLVSYAAWFQDAAPPDSGKDFISVEVSLDDGASWQVYDQIGPGGAGTQGGWQFRSFLVDPGELTRVRITRNDVGHLSQGLLMVDDLALTAVKCCPSDFDDNGYVNGADFDAFVTLFEAGDPSTDYDGNTFVNGADFDAFVTDFAAGC